MVVLRYNLYKEGRINSIFRIMSWHPSYLQR